MLKYVTCDEKSSDDENQKAQQDQFEPLFDEYTHRLPEQVREPGFERKRRTSRDDGQQHKQPEIVAGKSGGDGGELVGDGGHALDQDDGGAPFRVGGAERIQSVAVAVGLNQPMADRIVEKRADRIAQQSAENREEG